MKRTVKKEDKAQELSASNDTAGIILYLCDRQACGSVCPNQECYLTRDIRHAMNFKPEGDHWVENTSSGETILMRLRNTHSAEYIKQLYDEIIRMKRYGVILLPKEIDVETVNSSSATNDTIGFQ